MLAVVLLGLALLSRTGFLLLLPVLMLVAAVVSLGYGPDLEHGTYTFDLVATPYVAAALGGYALIAPLLTSVGRARSHHVLRSTQATYRLRTGFYKSFSLAAVALGAVFFIEIQPAIVEFIHKTQIHLHVGGKIVEIGAAHPRGELRGVRCAQRDPPDSSQITKRSQFVPSSQAALKSRASGTPYAS